MREPTGKDTSTPSGSRSKGYRKMAKYKVLVTARSFGTADSKALDLLAANDCEVKKLVAADGPIPEQLKKELPEADAVIAGL